MTKAEEVYTKVEALVAAGSTKADAFKQLAAEYDQPVNSLRGAYYSHTSRGEGASSAKPRRARRRETTPEDALADAREALDRAIASIDQEVETAKTRADETAAEYKALKDSAEAKKKAIATKRDALA